MVLIPLFGIIYGSLTFGPACVAIYLAQVVIAVAYIIKYDRNKTPDVAGIDAAKRHFKRLLGIKDGWSVTNVLYALGSFIFLIFAVSVPSLFLCFRTCGQKGFTIKGVYVILVGVTIKTVAYYKVNVSAWVPYKAFVLNIYSSLFG